MPGEQWARSWWHVRPAQTTHGHMSKHRRTQDFTMVHVFGGRARGSMVQGKVPVEGLGDEVQQAEAKCEIIVQF